MEYEDIDNDYMMGDDDGPNQAHYFSDHEEVHEEPPEGLFDDEAGEHNEDFREGEAENEDVGEDGQKLLESVWEKTEEEVAKKSKTRRPRPHLTEVNLVGPKGLPALKARFENYKFAATDGPYEKLTKLLYELEYWAHNLHPSMNFDDSLNRIELLGKKRIIKRAMQKLRSGFNLDDPDEARNVVANSDEEAEKNKVEQKSNKKKKKSNKLVDSGDERDEAFGDINWEEDENKNREALRNIGEDKKVPEDPDDGEFEWEPTTIPSNEDFNQQDSNLLSSPKESLGKRKKSKKSRASTNTNKEEKKGQKRKRNKKMDKREEENDNEISDAEELGLKNSVRTPNKKVVVEDLGDDQLECEPDLNLNPGTSQHRRSRIIISSDEEA